MAYLVLICSMNVLCQFYVYMYAGILLEDIAFNFDIATIIFFILERVIFSQVIQARLSNSDEHGLHWRKMVHRFGQNFDLE